MPLLPAGGWKLWSLPQGSSGSGGAAMKRLLILPQSDISHHLRALTIVGVFIVLGYSLGLLIPLGIVDLMPSRGLLLGLSLLIGWSQAASP